MEFEQCKGCEMHMQCDLQAAVQDVERVFKFADVKVKIAVVQILNGGPVHKVAVEPPEAYRAVMIVLGTLLKETAGVEMLSLKQAASLLANIMPTAGEC